MSDTRAALLQARAYVDERAAQSDALQRRLHAETMAKLARLEVLLAAGSSAAAEDPLLDDLLRAIHGAMGIKVWCACDLLQRMLIADAPGIALGGALASIGTRQSTKSLGTYLARRVDVSYITASGLELRRCGYAGKSLAWTIAEV